jgi:hypothetical protein
MKRAWFGTKRAAVLCALVLAIAPAARAAPEGSKQEARARFETAVRLFDEKDYAGALAEFRRANEVAPSSVVSYNLARCYEALARPVDAVRELSSVLNSGSAEEQTRARDLMSKLEARIGTIRVEGAAHGAHVEVDGLEVGIMPLKEAVRVASGTRIVTVIATGYAPFRTEVVVAGKVEVPVAVSLVPTEAKLAHLEVRVNVPGAEVRLAAQPVGITPIPAALAVLPGMYEVIVSRSGYTTERRSVTLGDGATGKLDVSLRESADGPKGSIVLRVSEPSPVVFIDGDARGPQLTLALPPGVHALRVEHAGFLPFRRELDLVAGAEQTVRVRLLPTAETREAYESSVRSRKTWSWVLIGGGAAIGGVGAVLALTASSAITEHKNTVNDLGKKIAVGSGDPCSESNGSDTDAVLTCKQNLESARAKLSNAQTRQVLGIAGAAVGGAALITGIVLLVTAPPSDRFTGNETGRYVRPTFGVAKGALSAGFVGSF